MGEADAYLNLNKAAWGHISHYGELDRRIRLIRKHILGTLFSAAGRLQFALLDNEIDQSQSQPHIFITGHWRSGTTYLHNLMCLDPHYTFPTTSDCMNPHSLLLENSRKTARGKTARRPMDNLMVSAQSPQEDEFALLNLGARSPYECLLFPQKLHEALSIADPESMELQDKHNWERTFRAFVHLISFVGNDRPVMFKSPTHSYRVNSIATAFPNAKFISIRRNPLEVFESTFRMWKSLFELYAIGPSINDDDLRETILKNGTTLERKMSDALGKLTKGRVAFLDYENLVQAPTSELQKIYETLNLDSSHLISTQSMQAIKKHKAYKALNEMPPPEWRTRVLSEWNNFTSYR